MTEIRTVLTAKSAENYFNNCTVLFFLIGCGLGLTLQVVLALLLEPLIRVRNAAMWYLLTDHMNLKLRYSVVCSLECNFHHFVSCSHGDHHSELREQLVSEEISAGIQQKDSRVTLWTHTTPPSSTPKSNQKVCGQNLSYMLLHCNTLIICSGIEQPEILLDCRLIASVIDLLAGDLWPKIFLASRRQSYPNCYDQGVGPLL